MVALVAIQETTGRILAIYCPDCCRKTFAVPAKFFNKKNSVIVVVIGMVTSIGSPFPLYSIIISNVISHQFQFSALTSLNLWYKFASIWLVLCAIWRILSILVVSIQFQSLVFLFSIPSSKWPKTSISRTALIMPLALKVGCIIFFLQVNATFLILFQVDLRWIHRVGCYSLLHHPHY